MYCLDKVSLSYSRDEDRVCLRSEVVEGQILWLWLTNRLARQLVPYLLQATGGSSDKQASPDRSNRRARGCKTDDNEPVPTSAELQENRLVHAIQLRSNSEHVELTFQSQKSADVAQIILSLTDLQKLLDGLRVCFEEAAWPCDIWREVTTEATSGTSASVTLH